MVLNDGSALHSVVTLPLVRGDFLHEIVIMLIDNINNIADALNIIFLFITYNLTPNPKPMKSATPKCVLSAILP